MQSAVRSEDVYTLMLFWSYLQIILYLNYR